MKFVDSHCHLNMLDLDRYNNDLGEVIEAAKSVGVETILCVAVDLDSAKTVIKIAEQFDCVWASVGLHPSNEVDQEPNEQDYIDLADHPKVVAMGEMGLDYYYNKTGHEAMGDRFRTQIRAARKVNKPIIVHTRDAREETLKILEEEQASQVGGVMHCFTETWAMAQRSLEMGFYISFSGIVTFKKAANVAEVAEQVPLDRLLIETDAPYLTPVPYRGKPNEPQFVRHVADRIAELKAVNLEVVAKQISDNFYTLFKGVNRP